MKHCPPKYKAINFYGDMDRQIVARKAFPILIELAAGGTHSTINYGELIDKIGLQYMPGKLKDPKTSNGLRALWMRYALASIWQTLWEYQCDSGIDIPYLTTIVVNAKSQIPTFFKKSWKWSDEKIATAQREVYDFQQWHDVMEHLLGSGD